MPHLVGYPQSKKYPCNSVQCIKKGGELISVQCIQKGGELINKISECFEHRCKLDFVNLCQKHFFFWLISSLCQKHIKQPKITFFFFLNIFKRVSGGMQHYIIFPLPETYTAKEKS